MTTRALIQYPTLSVVVMLEDGLPKNAAGGWCVQLRRKSDELQVWREGSEAAAKKRFDEVCTMLTVLDVIDSRRVH
jgi:hypothetical protein